MGNIFSFYLCQTKSDAAYPSVLNRIRTRNQELVDDHTLRFDSRRSSKQQNKWNKIPERLC